MHVMRHKYEHIYQENMMHDSVGILYTDLANAFLKELGEVSVTHDFDHLASRVMRRHKLLACYDSVQPLQPAKPHIYTV